MVRMGRRYVGLLLMFVMIELDALIVISYFVNDYRVHPRLINLVGDCRSLLQHIPSYSMPHIFREGNKCMDVLARFGGSLSFYFVIFSNPPDFVMDLVSFNMSAKVCLRLVPASS